MVEDGPAGFTAGRAAGMLVVGITTTHRAEALPADACVDTLNELPGAIAGLGRSAPPGTRVLERSA